MAPIPPLLPVPAAVTRPLLSALNAREISSEP